MARGREGLHGKNAIVAVSAQTLIAFTLTTLPTPLYQDYARQFGFSVLILTLIYATYVVGTLVTLIVFGRLSDQIGRKPVSLAALGLAGLSALVFLAASNTATLFVARLLTGVAAGLSSGTAVAWLREIYGEQHQKQASLTSVGVNCFALGFGPLLCGWLATTAWPLTLPYIAYGVLLLPVIAAVFWTEESPTGRRSLSGVSFTPRIGVPRDLRGRFLAPGLITFVIFSLVGFYSAIAPAVIGKALHIANHGISGSIIFELFAVAAIAALSFAWMSSRNVMLWGAGLMLPALAFLVWAQADSSLTAMLIGTAFGGLSLGLGYRGTLEVSNTMAPDDKRAELISALFVCGNLGLALPVIGIGVLSAVSTPQLATYVFSGVIALLSVAGLVFGLWLGKEKSD
jgi:MFS family permease